MAPAVIGFVLQSSPSESKLRYLVAGGKVLAQIFIQLRASAMMWVVSTTAYDEVGVVCSEFRDSDDDNAWAVPTWSFLECECRNSVI